MECTAISPIVVVVAGPTASGKTPLAIAVAHYLGAEIVNFDSVQLYRDFDLGTAKPTRGELAAVPHHLIGIADAHVSWTAGEYARQARPVIESILKRGRAVVLVGGTGFYLRALFEGLSPMPPGLEALRQRLRQRSPEQLHRLLQRFDPESARRIAPRDAGKVIRALEVRLITGRTLGDSWRAAPAQAWSPGTVLRLGLAPDRAALYERINRRAAQMFAGGIQEETRRLLAAYPPELRIWTSHGYKQACDIVLRGADRDTALAEAQQEQRNYAKRQWTWFRADARFRWLAGFGDETAVQQAAVAMATADSHAGTMTGDGAA